MLIATGTAPFVVSSTTLVTNLNADMVDGKHASDLLGITGSGTIGTIPKWANTTSLTNSIISEGSSVLIINPNTDPALYFQNTGTLKFNIVVSVADVYMTCANGNLIFNAFGTINISKSLDMTGNVIGNLSASGEKVIGSIFVLVALVGAFFWMRGK